MKLSKKLLSVIAFSGVVAFASVQAHEHGDGKGRDKNRSNHIERMAKHLDLSTEQQSNIKAMVDKFKMGNTRPDRQAMKSNHMEMKQHFAMLMENPNFDQAAVEQHLQQRSDKYNVRKINRLKLQHAIYQELSPEQQPKYLKMVEKKMRKMKRHNKGHGVM